MHKKVLPFEGSAVAIVTPFHRDGSIDFESFSHIIDFQIKSGTDAIVVLGTTGESSTLTDAERKSIIEFSVEKINHRVPLIVGTGTNRTAYSVELSRYSKECGCDSVLVVSPYYNKANDMGLIRHFTEIADAADCPVILYNIPGRSGMNIPCSVYLELSRHPNIVAIKEASGNFSYVADVISTCRGALAVYSGNDDQTLPIISLGGKGVISVVANIVPKIISELTHSALEGNLDIAREIQIKYNDLFKILFCEVNPIPIKYACELLGLCQGNLRLPLYELSEANKRKVENTLENYRIT